jgi:LysM repeat protein
MNTPNPLLPQGSLDRYSKGSSTVRIAVFTIVSIHAVFFSGLLMQGCRRDEAKAPLASADAFGPQNSLPPLGTNQYYTSEFEIPHAYEPPPAPAPVTSYQESFPPLRAPDFPAPSLDTKSYSIVKGDTFSSIAKAHNITLGALVKANPSAEPTRLKIGQRIEIPAPTPGTQAQGSLPAAPEQTRPLTPSGNSYVVKSGDNLTRIAKMHNTTVKAIQAANPQITSSRINVGQTLRLPAPSE